MTRGPTDRTTAPSEADGILVLHVDDDPDFVDLAAAFLERERDDVTVRTATSAAAGLDYLAEEPIDCIVSDYDMPTTDGLEFLQEVRGEYPELPFILFTGKGSEEIASEAISAGVTDYLQKGGETDQYTVLANRIANAVRGYRARQALERSEAEYRSLTEDVLDTSDVGVFILDAAFDVVWVNAAIEDYFGVDRDAILGADKRTLVRDRFKDLFESPERFAETVVATYDDNTYVEQFECHVLPGEDRDERWLEHWSQPIESGIYAGGRVEHYTDITDRKRREVGLETTERYRQRLYRITSDTDLSTEQKIERLLELGRERLEVENGHLVRIDPENERHEVVAAVGSELVEAEATTTLARTYCRRTITSDDILGVYNAEEEGWSDDPAHTQWNIGCYLGGKVLVREDLYGTVCFVDRTPRERPFTSAEKTFVDLMVRWIGRVLERREHARELRVKDRAMDVAPIGIVITDPSREDNPITYANDGFLRLTGYAEREVLGRNCRFLQGEDTDPEPVAEMREGIATERPTTVELLNYRKDGTPFWNLVSIAPVYDDGDTLTHFAGFQRDVTDRKIEERRTRR